MTSLSRRTLLVGLAEFGTIIAGSASKVGQARAATATIVSVDLWDKGIDSMAKLGSEPMRGFAMPGATLPSPTMGISTTPATVKAGEVTFEATNSSKDMVHEMVVALAPDPIKPLPYNADEQRVDEEKAKHLGEVSELEPGKSGALRITLKPGKYILYCNIPGHYALGMWTEITVAP